MHGFPKLKQQYYGARPSGLFLDRTKRPHLWAHTLSVSRGIQKRMLIYVHMVISRKAESTVRRMGSIFALALCGAIQCRFQRCCRRKRIVAVDARSMRCRCARRGCGSAKIELNRVLNGTWNESSINHYEQFFEIEQVRDSAAFLRHSLEDLGKYERMSLKSAKIATKWEVLRSINVALFFFQFWFWKC